ncbi:MAG TPA: hypothetical protein DIT67_01735 [Octadecabacter sp.]|nr:hypothetical protein [Octadecabacter sp.]
MSRKDSHSKWKYLAIGTSIAVVVGATGSIAQEFTCVLTEKQAYQYDDTLRVIGPVGYFSYRSDNDGLLTENQLQCGFSKKDIVCVDAAHHYSIKNLGEYTTLTTTTFLANIRDTVPDFPFQNAGVVMEHPVRCAKES